MSEKTKTRQIEIVYYNANDPSHISSFFQRSAFASAAPGEASAVPDRVSGSKADQNGEKRMDRKEFEWRLSLIARELMLQDDPALGGTEDQVDPVDLRDPPPLPEDLWD